MRRLLGLSVAFLLFVPVMVAAAETAHETITDRFDTVSFSGSNGSLEWSGPWVESGEDDGAGAGQISVGGGGECASGRCLKMSGGLLTALGVARPADLSVFLDARLSYFVRIDPALLSTSALHVEVRGNGSDWRRVASYSMLTDGGTHQESIDIGGHLGSDFRLRFRLTGLLGDDRVYIDDVSIAGSVVVPTTSTSSSTTTTEGSGGDSSREATATSSTTTTTRVASESVGDGSSANDDGLPVSNEETSSEASDEEEGTAGPGEFPGSGASTGPQVPRVGLMVDHGPGLDDLGDEIDVLAAGLDADFSLAVEVFERARIWISILALMIAAAVITGAERRRSREPPV